jgi:hypothetical protein
VLLVLSARLLPAAVKQTYVHADALQSSCWSATTEATATSLLVLPIRATSSEYTIALYGVIQYGILQNFAATGTVIVLDCASFRPLCSMQSYRSACDH